jgi:hypothetical protein
MKKIFSIACCTAFLTFVIACGASKKAEREADKRKKDAAKMEQLEKDKKQFEQRNNSDLGK